MIDFLLIRMRQEQIYFKSISNGSDFLSNKILRCVFWIEGTCVEKIIRSTWI